MEFIRIIVRALFWMVTFDFAFFLIGIVAFKFGAKKFGHMMIGHIGGSFGLTQHWLYDNCPYAIGYKCDLWTCKGYGKNSCKCSVFEKE